MRWKRGVLAILIAAGLPGCGRELVGGGQREVEGHATAGGGDAAGAAPAYARAGEGGPALQLAGTLGGSVAVDARLSLVRGTAPAPVGAGSATVRADGRDTVLLARGSVPEASYSAARVAFTRVTAQVTGGLVAGGVEITGRVDVAIAPGDSVVVEVPVELSGTRAPVRLLVELDAETWLRLADPVTRTVPAAAFRSAVRVRTF